METPFVNPNGKGKVHMVMAKGTIVNFDDVENTKIDLEEIGTHVMNISRYCGAIPVKLIHHLKITGILLGQAIQDSIYGLGFHEAFLQKVYAQTHDFSEAYVGDVVTGLKHRPLFREYRELEDQFDELIHRRLGLPIEYRNDKLIKRADHYALVYEMMIHNHPSCLSNKEKLNVPIDPIYKLAVENVFKVPPAHLWEEIKRDIVEGRWIIKEYYGKEKASR